MMSKNTVKNPVFPSLEIEFRNSTTEESPPFRMPTLRPVKRRRSGAPLVPPMNVFALPPPVIPLENRSSSPVPFIFLEDVVKIHSMPSSIEKEN